jgi:hypothetical protein
MPPQLLARYTIYITRYDNRIQNGAHNCHGAYQSSGFQSETRQTGQSHPEHLDHETKRHKGWPAAGTFWGPIEGTQHPEALYLSPDWEVSFMPLCVGWHLAVWVFPPGITWERRLK